MRRNRTISTAVRIVVYGDRVSAWGFVGIVFPNALTVAPEDRFVENGPPRGLTLFYATRQGDDGERGLDHFAHDGPGAGAIGGHWAWRPGSGRWPVPGTSRPIACPRA